MEYNSLVEGELYLQVRLVSLRGSSELASISKRKASLRGELGTGLSRFWGFR